MAGNIIKFFLYPYFLNIFFISRYHRILSDITYRSTKNGFIKLIVGQLKLILVKGATGHSLLEPNKFLLTILLKKEATAESIMTLVLQPNFQLASVEVFVIIKILPLLLSHLTILSLFREFLLLATIARIMD